MIWWRKINTTEGDNLVQRHPCSHCLQRGVQMNLTKQDLFMSRATPQVALSFREFLVKILKPENDGVLELVKNVSCNPNTAGLYLLKSRASSSKLAWNPRKFHWIMEYSIASVRWDGWQVHFVIGQGRKLVRKNQILLCLLQSVWSYRLGRYLWPAGRSGWKPLDVHQDPIHPHLSRRAPRRWRIILWGRGF